MKCEGEWNGCSVRMTAVCLHRCVRCLLRPLHALFISPGAKEAV